MLIETNIDDMNPQFYAPLLDRLFAAGALDAWLTPIVMKKGRPAITVSVLAAPEASERTRRAADRADDDPWRAPDACQPPQSRALLRDASATPWGPARVKLKHWRGRVSRQCPNTTTRRPAAQAAGLPVATVHATVAQLAESLAEPPPADQSGGKS